MALRPCPGPAELQLNSGPREAQARRAPEAQNQRLLWDDLYAAVASLKAVGALVGEF